MLGFGRGSYVEVLVNGVSMTFSANGVLKLIRENFEMKEKRDRLQANHDEAVRKAELLEGRLAAANMKLKEFGNPGQF
tara:strand:- start:12 stop:245 length:234 start_codon:yes stop_codon:yes gene_type:complete